jgi:DNA gyrase subunit B
MKAMNISVGNIRPCRWKPSCYEFDAAMKDKAHIFFTVGPQIPLINEYRAAINLYQTIKEYLKDSFVIKVSEREIEAPDWHELLTTIKAETFRGSHLQRYKGLGEMNPEQLWDTTMDPQHRMLLQVTIKDAEAADDIFTTLMGDKVEPRRDFIYNHALEVSEIDI